MSIHSVQINLPPTLVNPVNPSHGRVKVKRLNPLNLVRRAREKCGMKLAAMAMSMGISEPLLSAQLSEQELTKHLSMRKLASVEDVNFWKEFALLILEDLGFSVVVMTPAEKSALAALQSASATYTELIQR